MSRNLLGRFLVTSASLALAACGGDGATYVASLPPPPAPPPPPPPPPPSPPPSPAQSPAIFPNITTNTTFAALGLEANNRSYPLNAPINNNTLIGDGFSVKFDVASNAYLIGLPSQAPGSFVAFAGPQGPGSWSGYIQGTPFDNVSISTSTPSAQLAYTAFGVADGYYTSALSFFAFGSATPASGIPVTGSATYDAYVAGATLDYDASHFPSRTIGGSATLQFNFGAGMLTGHFDPILIVSWPVSSKTNLGSYTFVNTMYGAMKTDFSGQLSVPGNSTLGDFNGQFTGPSAQELMAKWTAPFLVPGTQQWSQMFGVWVGKKK